MRKPYLYLTITIGIFVVLVSGVLSCTRVNGINNDQVIETPFSVFFADSSGSVYSSNDGANINKQIFEADRYPCRAITVAYNNILFVKQNLYISTNNGVSFNHSYDSVASYPEYACNNYPFDLNQSMLVNVPGWNHVYVTNDDIDPNNFMGLCYNLFGGDQGDWYLDTPDSTGYIGNLSPAPYIIRITSLTLLPDDTLCGYDANSGRCFYRTKGSLWNECTANSDPGDWPNIGDPHDFSGTPLPHHSIFVSTTTPIDTTARYSYGHYNNRLIAIDQKNCNANGAYYSDDRGRNWSHYTGLPSSPLLCIESPFEEVALIGTAGAGLYILNTNTNTWQANNNGLGRNLTVRSITGKQRIYKNGKVQKYIFLATDNGIYQSVDGGNNWTQTRPGNYTAIF